MYFFIGRPQGFASLMILGLSVLFVVQSALTFSRGGLYNILVSLPVAFSFFIRYGSHTRRQVFVFLLALVFVVLAFADNLNNYTNGLLFDRFQSTFATGRVELIQADLQVWQQNPIIGVGVGVSSLYHFSIGNYLVASHTEYSRLLAEHGLFGLISLFILAIILAKAFFRLSSDLSRGAFVGLVLWSLMEMTHSAMRIAAISIVLALPLAFMDWDQPLLDQDVKP
jgi:O-antigen ligase